MQPGTSPGPSSSSSADGYWEVVEALRLGFPDLAHETLDLVVAGDRVTELFQVTGTHLGLFQGVEPTGRWVSFTGAAVFTVTGGRAVEDRTTVDLLSLLQQIGAIPATQTAAGTSAASSVRPPNAKPLPRQRR